MARKKVLEQIDSYVEKIITENLEDIVGERFGRYSKYIIQDRALPDVRDGLKPVQRRILFSMYKLGMFSDKPYKKSARIVGDVIGKYHPHGDTSVYDAMVRLSQPWKVRCLLIDMHGNNGSIDGDSAAAMRYTEARMSKISEYLLKDIDKRTVDFVPNFDDEEYEPTVLPARYPNLLVNGATGISAGYATEIPPHNLREVIKAVILKIDDPTTSMDQILKVVKGPDFPTGGIVQGKDEIRKAFETGRGKILIRSKLEIIDHSIIVTELPYEVNKANLVRKIDDIRISKQIEGIQEVRDESDREGLRIAIDIKKEANPELILNFLLKKTDLQRNYNYNMVAINNKRPVLMGILEIIDAYILHQKEVTTNRSNFELTKAQKRLHIVDGIIKMMDVLDEVIHIIRSSSNKRDAKDRLMEAYSFSEEQAEAIVTLQLYRLSSTDILALEKEKKDLNKLIDALTKVLHNEGALQKVIKDELEDFLKSFKAPRLTVIEEEIEKITINEEDLITEEQVMVGVTKEGYIKRSSIRSYRATNDANLKEFDTFMVEKELSTLDTLLIFTNQGNYIFIPVYKVPDYKWKDLGTHINNIVQLDLDERIIKVLDIQDFSKEQYLLFATRNNLVKISKLSDFLVSRFSKTIKAIGLNKGDSVVSITVTNSLEKEVMVATENGLAIRFDLMEIPLTQNTAKGVKAMNIAKNQKLAYAVALEDNNDLLVLTNRGTIKRVNILSIPKKKRANRGTHLYKEVKSNPYLVVALENLNATQYKNKVGIKIITSKGEKIISAFDIKTDTTENGKSFIKKKEGIPEFIQIEKIELDDTIPPLSEYVKEDEETEVQTTLFD
ncbi:DNA topoisomerase IV subunit A [Candidatus Izimaplasma bacterium ZiA1]|uniref:DNA topoisomerase IV subunit A n=1 Tax=Candidatus Izimoplasma sp. ZiA1 TaxID=2024899 RepID=UPI000BAA64FB|nr:DNA topoisomerase IV subunit A [Candidatus Izimaplasma bacterium ZiA1]